MINIAVIEGGERLYIHPFSYSESNKNKVLYFQSREFPPYSSEFLLEPGSINFYLPWTYLNRPFVRSIKKFYYCEVKRFLVAMLKWASLGFIYKRLLPISLLGYFYETGVPFAGIDVCDTYISIPHQITLTKKDDPSPFNFPEEVEEVYLTPSQHWLEKQLDLWITMQDRDFSSESGDATYKEYREENIREFITWRDKQLTNGLSIGYLCSLDT